MKKTLLTIASALMFMAPVMGETTEYGYCSSSLTSIGSGSQGYYSVAIEIPAEVAKAYKGSKITKLMIGFGSGTNRNMDVYVTRQLGGEPIVTAQQKVKSNSINEVTLETPVEIGEEALYIGYTYKSTGTSTRPDYPIGVDGNKYGYTPYGTYCAIVTSEAALNDPANYLTLGPDYGNLWIRAVIEGDNLPANVAMISDVEMPTMIRPWKDYDMSVKVRNMGTKDMSSATVGYRLNPADWGSVDVTFETPLKPGETSDYQTFSTRLGSYDDNGSYAEYRVDKVGDVANAASEVTTEVAFTCSRDLFERRMVVEEYTGLQCGYCPRGYAALEEFSKEVTDGSFIAIAAHNYGSDPMSLSAYNSWVSKYISGAPGATYNREKDYMGLGIGYDLVKQLYADIHTFCKEDVQLEVNYKEGDEMTAVAKATMQFSEDIDDANYGLAFVVTQDDLGPYNQSNYFAGGAQGECFGFESQGSVVSLMFNDVARDLYNWTGDSRAVPTTLKKGEVYTWEKEVSLSRCKGLKNASMENVNVIVLLIDKKTEAIANAAKCKIGSKSESGVEGAEVESREVPTVYGHAGEITVSGEYETVSVYGIDGKFYGSFGEGGSLNVASGLYIVNVNCGDKTFTAKVIVK